MKKGFLKKILGYGICKGMCLVIPVMLICWNAISQVNTMSLSGEWEVKLDSGNEQLRTPSGTVKTEGAINLPGSLAEYGYGVKTVGSDFGILTPEYKYIGKAWYSRKIRIPSSWKNKETELFLERVLWESTVLIDGIERSRKDALGTPHVHRLGRIEPGEHTVTVLVDNEMIHNIGDKGHAYSDYTQSIWNGIVGRIELRAFDPVRIEKVRTFPDPLNDLLRLEVTLNNRPAGNAKLNYSVVSVKTGKQVLAGREKVASGGNHKQFEINVPVNGILELWSEFTPEVYALKITLSSGRSTDVYETEFGYFRVGHDGTKILVNGNPVFLRGNNDCVHFPLTGYPSCNLEDWERIFRIYKDYGLNHARFHSWCPPEAAFKAANRMGIYLQAEASIWIDWWMSRYGGPRTSRNGYKRPSCRFRVRYRARQLCCSRNEPDGRCIWKSSFVYHVLHW